MNNVDICGVYRNYLNTICSDRK